MELKAFLSGKGVLLCLPRGSDMCSVLPLAPRGSLQLLLHDSTGSKEIWLVFECDWQRVDQSPQPPLSKSFLWALPQTGVSSWLLVCPVNPARTASTLVGKLLVSPFLKAGTHIHGAFRHTSVNQIFTWLCYSKAAQCSVEEPHKLKSLTFFFSIVRTTCIFFFNKNLFNDLIIIT